MVNKKYPIGTPIKFLYEQRDYGKTGTIVGFQDNGNPIVFLPMADRHLINKHYPKLSDGTEFTWGCRWSEIEPLKGVQLLFDFMV